MVKGINKILNKEDNMPNSWLQSKTVMIQKKKKPTLRDLRPIALTNATYKMFMGILKSKLEKHIRDIGQESEVQAGCTKNRRIADNLFVLDYCVKESYKIRKPLFLISIDFAKAVDSVKRDKLVNVLKKYRIHPDIIDIIVHIYNGDITKVHYNNMFQCDINVSSGIRQGCNASSNLFLLITYCIIEKLYDNLSGVNTNICKIVALFFADDGMILMQSLRETKESIQVLMNIAEECGMNINKTKSNIMIFNH